MQGARKGASRLAAQLDLNPALRKPYPESLSARPIWSASSQRDGAVPSWYGALRTFFRQEIFLPLQGVEHKGWSFVI